MAGIRDFKTIWRRNSGFTGLSENLDRDNGKGSLFNLYQGERHVDRHRLVEFLKAAGKLVSTAPESP